MFTLDEAAINEQFGRMLGTMPSRMVSRSAVFPVMRQLALLRLPGLKLLPLLGYEEIEFGLEVQFNRAFLERASADAIELVIQQFLDAMMRGIVDENQSIGYPLTVGSLMFEYIESVGGTEILVTVLIEWGFLR